MSTNNHVSQVLVTKGNQAPAAVGTDLDALAVGQIGVFDRENNLAIDGTGQVKDFYVAVGIDSTGDTVKDDICTSAGQMIQKRNIKEYSFRPHTPAKPMIFTFGGYVYTKCDTEYGIRLEFRNQAVYQRQGYNQYSKYYGKETSCCTGCEGCPTGDGNEISINLANLINNDEDKLASAVIIARQALTNATHGTSVDYAIGAEVSEADAKLLITFNEGKVVADKVFTDVQITTNPLAVNTYCSINLNYKYPRFTVIVPSKVEGFDCEGVFTTTQEAVAEEGSGYDVRQKEYHAGGWNGNPGPYRASTATGLGFDIDYKADAAIKYDLFHLEYDQFSVAGWGENLNNLSTMIAIPATETTTRDAFAAILDAIVAPLGHEPLADDAAAADVDPTVDEPTEGKTETTDGLS